MIAKEIVSSGSPTQWVPGKSGNPKGRPLTRRDKILESKLKLEQIVRGRISPERIGKVIETLLKAAEKGDTKAAKTLLPFFLTAASHGQEEDTRGDRGGIVFRIENATIKPQRQVIAIDAEVIENG